MSTSYQPYGTVPHGDAPPKPPKSRGKKIGAWIWTGLGLGVLITVCGAGILALGVLAWPATAPPTPAPSSYAPAVVPTGPTHSAPSVVTTTKPPAPATPAAPPPVAKATVDDGTWTVGEDVPPGTYRAVGTVETCYWEIDKSGTNGQSIVANGNGPGNLHVTLKVGQDFSTERCGVWTKV